MPDPTDMNRCIPCARGRYYNATMDTCRTPGGFLNCEYDTICRDCKIDANIFCLECSSIENGVP